MGGGWEGGGERKVTEEEEVSFIFRMTTVWPLLGAHSEQFQCNFRAVSMFFKEIFYTAGTRLFQSIFTAISE